MNDKEIIAYNKLVELISPYSEDSSTDVKEEILEKVNELSGIEVEIFDLDTYWKACSVEDFCKDLAVERVKPSVLSEVEILNVIKLIYEAGENIEDFDYYLAKYSNAIEYHFKKTTGSLLEAVYSDENDTFDKVIETLQKSDTICL